MKKKIEKLLKISMWIVVIAFVMICWVAIGVFSEKVTAYSLFGHAGEAIGVAVIIVWIYEKWIWKWDPFIKDAKYAGKYKGRIIPQKEGNEIEAILEITQSFLFAEVVMYTDESRSRTISGISEEILGVQELIYTYMNEPKAGVRDKSNVHFGTARLSFNNIGELCGEYYTDRNTVGDMVFQRVDIG